jgi:hypothetical protein
MKTFLTNRYQPISKKVGKENALVCKQKHLIGQRAGLLCKDYLKKLSFFVFGFNVRLFWKQAGKNG